MRTDDLRLLVAALVLLLTGAFLTTPAKADQRPHHCAFGPPSTPPPTAHRDGTDRTGRMNGRDRTARWTAPTVRYRLSAGYGAKGHLWKHRHTGQDFAVHTGTPVYAVGPGRVVAASCGDGFGNQVVLHHPDGYYTQYAHLSAINVRPGQRVSAGQRIGAAGSTGNADGPHLHFEVRTTRRLSSAVPPLRWLRHHGVSVSGTSSPGHPHPSTPAASARPPAGGTKPAPSWHGRPPRTPETPAPQGTPANQWNPTVPWDPTKLWAPMTR
ncbi:M23 family metallopeptidase [Streptomyces sp. GbtcB6]|uniref:M23 family metallopeptidase n=1 Tax=Streptomyces sp. GbtcB6 TaxID=2824751 RepID=UPI001C309829|nr:M23 family metallopeptidase [Streptomyces sp. GbtcB6]